METLITPKERSNQLAIKIAMAPVSFCDGTVQMKPLGPERFCYVEDCNNLAIQECNKRKSVCCCCNLFKGCGAMMCKKHMYYQEKKDEVEEDTPPNLFIYSCVGCQSKYKVASKKCKIYCVSIFVFLLLLGGGSVPLILMYA